MKLKLEFVSKVPKLAKENEVILIKGETSKNKIAGNINKSIFNNKLFLEKKFYIQNANDKTYIFVNCMKSKTSLDYEKLGSNLYVFLRNNKIENCFYQANFSKITNVQLEKFLHGAQLKSYEFNVYKTDKSKISNTKLYVVGNKYRKINLFFLIYVQPHISLLLGYLIYQFYKH